MTRFARPDGQPAHCVRRLSNGRCPLSTPVPGFSPRLAVQQAKKSPYLRTSSSLNMAVRRGLTRFARPDGQPAHCVRRLSNGRCPLSTPVTGFSPRLAVQQAKKKPVLAYELFFKYGGEAGIRTPDTLPYTHFPGVLLQPLGHLTILFCCTPWVGNGALL